MTLHEYAVYSALFDVQQRAHKAGIRVRMDIFREPVGAAALRVWAMHAGIAVTEERMRGPLLGVDTTWHVTRCAEIDVVIHCDLEPGAVAA
jgi:hypothetical protein